MMKNAPDNKQWFQQFLAGDGLAFKHYFDQHNRNIFYTSFKIVNDTAVAQDIVADSFKKLWEHRDKIRSESHIAGFLTLVARNASLNYLEHEERKQATEDELRYLSTDLDNADLARNMIEAEFTKNLHKAVEQLPKMCKAVFKLLYFEQATTREAAERLGISERNVLNQKAIAIEKLRGFFSG
jgi:RNA polymerase sigma-70 factor (family 1)